MRMPCGSACPTESLPEQSEVSGWENLPEEAMVRAATLHTTSSCQRAPPSGVKGPAESTEDTSSEELLPDTDMWQRQPPVPPLPRRLRAAEHTQSGATSGQSHWCAGVALQTPHLAQSSVRRLPPALESQECLQIIRLV